MEIDSHKEGDEQEGIPLTWILSRGILGDSPAGKLFIAKTHGPESRALAGT